jgi:hypothetical protein
MKANILAAALVAGLALVAVFGESPNAPNRWASGGVVETLFIRR